MKIESQQISAVIDPSFTTASSLDADVHGQVSTGTGAGGAHTSQIGHYVTHTVLLPTGDGRVDMIGNSTGDKLEVSETLPDGSPVKWSAEHVSSNVRVDAVAAASIGTIVRAAMSMVPVAIAAQQSAQPPGGVPPEARKGARDVVLTCATCGPASAWTRRSTPCRSRPPGMTAAFRQGGVRRRPAARGRASSTCA